MSSLHKKIKSLQSNQICIQLQDIKLDFTKNRNNGYISRKIKVKINGESLFSNDKLVWFYLDTAKIHHSQNKPLQLTFQDENGKLKNYLYKTNSELSIDIFFNSITEYIYELVDCPYNLYNLLMTSQQSGIIEMKQGRLISSFESIQQLKRFLIFSEEDYTLLINFKQHKGFSNSRIDNFLKSLAISIIICYLFEIRDRTSDNILMDKEGRVFHIDYEYTLGSSPSYLKPKIEIPSLLSRFLKSDSLILNKFYHLLSNYFKIIVLII
ncbi:Phosphatidylinositol 3-kinase [Nosema bombycis CQ1]|uniref:Phosphatidylinositol 3-kinase n=1 Tax=Nosema bombycis (strain CQ1 / CVCC 102059) TaxID=578461 RepID=R0LZA9_NOSB1|nr:Phosphatidylinositol 3-kinase [Nosema bombycis CQ1]|eukprot:EOB11149.1 Phosphatidylinositol 3-kinase [Nosema bombycis CQ1]